MFPNVIPTYYSHDLSDDNFDTPSYHMRRIDDNLMNYRSGCYSSGISCVIPAHRKEGGNVDLRWNPEEPSISACHFPRRFFPECCIPASTLLFTGFWDWTENSGCLTSAPSVIHQNSFPADISKHLVDEVAKTDTPHPADYCHGIQK